VCVRSGDLTLLAARAHSAWRSRGGQDAWETESAWKPRWTEPVATPSVCRATEEGDAGGRTARAGSSHVRCGGIGPVALATTGRRPAATMHGVSLRLSPKQVQAIGDFICGGTEHWPYRRMVDITSFVRFTGVKITHEVEVGSRGYSACSFVEEAESGEEVGLSGLRRDTEKVL
jgi:hypothetical protein